MTTVFSRTTRLERESIQRWSRSELAEYQLQRLNQVLAAVLPRNEFYQMKFGSADLRLNSVSELQSLEFTCKNELIGNDSSAGFAKNLTYPIDQYSRFHRTSGTKGRPMIVLDTREDWQWWMETWQYVLDAAELTAEDRVAMAFSFGPFIGFWSAFDAAVERGCLVAPTGALSSVARLELIQATQATAVFCTPSYALHLVEVARVNQIDIGATDVRCIIVAGEPGGSIPAIKNQIESVWNAKVIDHSGASEVGPWGFADPNSQGIYVNEAQFIAEFVSLETGEPAREGELSELVLTSLGRIGSPVFRYRTGDLVRPTWEDKQVENFVLLQGGVLGRTDDMMIIRGMNIFPSSVEQILRGFPEVVEYRMTAFKEASLDQLKIEVEDRLDNPRRIREELKLRLGLRVDVECVPIGTLPRFEAKGKRFVDIR